MVGNTINLLLHLLFQFCIFLKSLLNECLHVAECTLLSRESHSDCALRSILSSYKVNGIEVLKKLIVVRMISELTELRNKLVLSTPVKVCLSSLLRSTGLSKAVKVLIEVEVLCSLV